MPQINIYIGKNDLLLDELRDAAIESGSSMNELAYDVLRDHLTDHVRMLKRIRILREVEKARLHDEVRVREQAELDRAIRRSSGGLFFLYSRAWIEGHGLQLDVSPLGPAPKSWGDPVLNALLKPLLAETGGHLVTQEQVIAACVEIGGLDHEEASAARKAQAKAQPALVEKFGQRFITGAVERGIDEKAAAAFWQRMMYGELNFSLDERPESF